MNFKDMLNDDLDIFFDEDDFADPAEYLPDGSAEATSLSVICDIGNDLATTNRGQRSEAIFYIRVDALASPPKFKDRITHNSLIWIVENLLKQDNQMYMVQAYREARAILSKANK